MQLHGPIQLQLPSLHYMDLIVLMTQLPLHRQVQFKHQPAAEHQHKRAASIALMQVLVTWHQMQI